MGVQTVQVDESLFRNRFIGVIAILTTFVIMVSGGFLTVHRLVTGPYCDCGLSLLLTVVAMSIAGVIVGITTYYYLHDTLKAKKHGLREKALKTTRFLPEDQRKILELIIDNGGEMLQKEIVENLDLGKVKVSRTLKKMEKRQIIERMSEGMTNNVKLVGDFKEILVEA